MTLTLILILALLALQLFLFGYACGDAIHSRPPKQIIFIGGFMYLFGIVAGIYNLIRSLH